MKNASKLLALPAVALMAVSNIGPASAFGWGHSDNNYNSGFRTEHHSRMGSTVRGAAWGAAGGLAVGALTGRHHHHHYMRDAGIGAGLGAGVGYFGHRHRYY